MPFVKLDCSILDSTIWLEDDYVRLTWITMLAMADADGFVNAKAPGIANRARLPLEKVRAALLIFEHPDADSRTDDDNGTRIKPVDGGFLVINYSKYRHKDQTHAARQQRYRDKRRINNLQTSDASLTSQTGQSDSKAEAEAEKNNTSSEPKAPDKHPEEQKAIEEVWRYYLGKTGRNGLIYTFTPSRKQKATARFKECLKKVNGDTDKAAELMKIAVDSLVADDFHMGRDAKTKGKKYIDWNDHLFSSCEQMEKWLNAE